MTRKSSQSQPSDPCVKCRKNVNVNDDGILCDYCKQWIHLKCAGWTLDAYLVIEKLPGFKYFCSCCSPNVDRILDMEKRLSDFEERLEARMSRLEQTFTNANFKPSFQPQSVDLVNVIKTTMEAESKRHNAVLFGVPEAADDLTAVQDLISAAETEDVNLQVKPSDIVRVFRDGPRRADSPRFLKVVCVTSAVQRSFIGLVNKVIKPTNQLIRARPDLTWAQRDAGRKLRDKWDGLAEKDKYFIDYGKQSIVYKTDRKNVIFSLLEASGMSP